MGRWECALLCLQQLPRVVLYLFLFVCPLAGKTGGHTTDARMGWGDAVVKELGRARLAPSRRANKKRGEPKGYPASIP